MAIAYYPGCSDHGLSQEYGVSTRTVFEHLNIDLKEVDDWNCCGATAAHCLKHDLATALNVRNLALVENMGLDTVVTGCAGCFSRLKTAEYEVDHHPDKIKQMSAQAGVTFPETVKVRHMLQAVLEAYTLDEIKEKVTKPLTGLKAACYYGCLLTRPKAVTQFDDPDNPMAMDNLMKALGAETVNWSYKAECCGGGFSGTEPGTAGELAGKILYSARDAGANAIVVACPLCQMSLDARQGEVGKEQGIKYNIPVMYFTQLMGLAMGYNWDQMKFGKLFTSPKELLGNLNLL